VIIELPIINVKRLSVIDTSTYKLLAEVAVGVAPASVVIREPPPPPDGGERPSRRGTTKAF